MQELGKRTIQVGVTLGAIVGLVGCAELAGDTDSEQLFAVQSENGLTMNGLTMNGLTMNGMTMNGLTMNGLTMNGLTMNGLMAVNGLSTTSGLMTTAGGRDVVKYMVKCALPAGDSITKQDQNGTSFTFPGGIGVAPELKNGPCDVACQERVSACMLAHVNNSGTNIDIWIDSEGAIGWGTSPDFPYQEGSFFGNLFPNPWQGFYCNGKGYDAGSVPGRLGAPLASNVYVNPYGGNVECGVVGPVRRARRRRLQLVQHQHQRRVQDLDEGRHGVAQLRHQHRLQDLQLRHHQVPGRRGLEHGGQRRRSRSRPTRAATTRSSGSSRRRPASTRSSTSTAARRST